MQMALDETALEPSRGARVWRPVQYLGSKLRLLDQLRPYLHSETPGTAVDLFSGTSLVSQVLSQHRPVVGVDESAFSRPLFEAGVVHAGRVDTESLRHLTQKPAPQEGPTAESALIDEARLVRHGEVGRLTDLYRSEHERFDREYRPTGAWWNDRVRGSFDHVLEAHFGGHFFSFSQARELDWLRSQIGMLPNEAERSVGTAVLLATASSLVASAGKHFAQPLNFLSAETSPFVYRRLLEDRRREVIPTFLGQLKSFATLDLRPFGPASSFLQTTVPSSAGLPQESALVYADPPYTVDEYSRFYHVLSIMVRSSPFVLALRGQRPTKGRYPADRTTSEFCDSSRAPGAFSGLCRAVSSSGARLVLSYSGNVVEGSRRRTIALSLLREICEASFGRVEILPLNHQYRRFQPRYKLSPSASEFVLVCE